MTANHIIELLIKFHWNPQKRITNCKFKKAGADSYSLHIFQIKFHKASLDPNFSASFQIVYPDNMICVL